MVLYRSKGCKVTSSQSWRFEKILPLGRSRTKRGKPGQLDHPQNFTDRNFAALRPTKTHSPYLERFKTSVKHTFEKKD